MIISIVLLVIGMVLIALSIRHLFLKGRLMKASVSGTIGGLSLFVAVIITLLIFNLQTYVQLTKEVDLAEVEIAKIKDNGASINLIIQGKKTNYLISAEEWRLDARFIKWKPWFTLLGKEPIVRLESIGGRFNKQVSAPTKTYRLSHEFKQLDKLVTYLTDQFGVVDAMYGSSVYMPIKIGARYQVSATNSGLIVRPINRQGQNAVQNWK